MSYRQYGTMRYIRNHEVHVDHLRMFNLTTFGSLLTRGWVSRRGTLIALSDEGERAFQQYTHASLEARKVSGELSDRVSLMLNLKLYHANSTKGAA